MKRYPTVVLTLLLLLLGGCAIKPTSEAASDPLEGLNRGVYAFNETFDQYLLKPVATSYRHYTPAPVNRGITNFFPISAICG